MEISDTSISSRNPRHRIIEDFVVVWLDPALTEINTDHQKFISQLHYIINCVSIFSDLDQCIDFITDLTNEKLFLIVSDTYGDHLVSLIHDFSQIQTIYLFSELKSKDQQWSEDLKKVKGIFNQTQSICDSLKRDIRQTRASLMPISIMNNFSSSVSLNELDQSFMYTQLLKDILLKMEDNKETKGKLVEYCRLQYNGSRLSLKIIEEFDQNYPDPSPIWWYTRECFVYWMLNKALRIQDVEVIIKMGFFARDLHREIEQLHTQSNHRDCFTVYRGQGMGADEFTKMSQSQGGLLSFNSFLSTSTDRMIAQTFADSARNDPDLIGVLFQLEIDPSISSTPFISPDTRGYYADVENEIIFSMHTVFRIGVMKQMEDRLWEVHLTLTSDNDKQINRLTEFIREKTDAPTELHRLGSLMFVMGEFNKAEDIFNALLETTSNEDWTGRASLYHMLGYVNHEKNNQSTALIHFEQSLNIERANLPPDNRKLCRNYAGIGLVLKEQGDLDEALKYFQLCLDIERRESHPNQVNIATLHNNIGGVFDAQEKYSEALESYKRTLEIELNHLSPSDPSLSKTYSNIADTYHSLGDNSKALDYYQKALEIQTKSLPSNHPWFATTYNNIASVHDSLEDSSTALSFYMKSLEMQQKSSLPNDPSLAVVHYNIARTLEDLHRCREAIEHASKAVDIARRAFGPDHSETKEYQEYFDELQA